MRRRLRASTAAVFVALSLVGAACGGGGDDDVKTAGASTSSSIAGGSTTTSTSVDPAASTTTTPAAGPSTTRTGSPAATTAAPAVTAPPAPAPPGPVALTPPAAGSYTYATSGQTTVTGPFPIPALPFPAVTTNRIDPAAGTRQHMRRNLQDGSGNGSIVDYIFDYRPDGVYLESLKFTITIAGQTSVQDLTPPAPLLFLATGAAPGASLTLNIPVGAGSARVVVDVPRTERVTIGGQSIETLVVRSTATLPAGDVTGTQTLTVNLDPSSRLWVKESGVGDGTAVVAGVGTFQVKSQYAATIGSITPG